MYTVKQLQTWLQTQSLFQKQVIQSSLVSFSSISNSSPFVLPVEKIKSSSSYGETEETLMADTFKERRRWIALGKEVTVKKMFSEEFPLLLRNPIEVSEDL